MKQLKNLWALLKIKLWGFLKQAKIIAKNAWKETKKIIRSDKISRKIKARVNRGIRKIIELEKDYYKLVRVGNFCNNNYIEYESTDDKHKTLSIKKYLDEIKPSDTWKIQLKIGVNFISSKDNDEELHAFKEW